MADADVKGPPHNAVNGAAAGAGAGAAAAAPAAAPAAGAGAGAGVARPRVLAGAVEFAAWPQLTPDEDAKVDVITTALAAIDAGGARKLKAGELEQFLAPLVRPFAHFSDAKDSADAKAMLSVRKYGDSAGSPPGAPKLAFLSRRMVNAVERVGPGGLPTFCWWADATAETSLWNKSIPNGVDKTKTLAIYALAFFLCRSSRHVSTDGWFLCHLCGDAPAGQKCVNPYHLVIDTPIANQSHIGLHNMHRKFPQLIPYELVIHAAVHPAGGAAAQYIADEFANNQQWLQNGGLSGTAKCERWFLKFLMAVPGKPASDLVQRTGPVAAIIAQWAAERQIGFQPPPAPLAAVPLPAATVAGAH